MRHGVILCAQNEIENFCENLFRKMNMDFEERATTINLVQGSMYRQLAIKKAYDGINAYENSVKNDVSSDDVKEHDSSKEE